MDSIQTYFIDVLRYSFADFSGQASKSEFWHFLLYKWLLILFAPTILGVLGIPFNLIFSILIFYIILLIPTAAVAVRRLHDTGVTG